MGRSSDKGKGRKADGTDAAAPAIPDLVKQPGQSTAAPASGAASGAPAPYVVLARKYRPATFDDLIGQEVMVRTLRNAFAMDRIAQAYMLTGVRGVGKTTTARILARALNYEVPGGSGTPTLDMPELGVHCREIMESRHVDVLEMDAASNTGIDDVREIIEAVRYKPASARYRVFIVDEVHMLSKAAFNGLLKTLEEPPPHVKFIFATTEIRKVPVTILSRCQRFDLRRVDQGVLAAHFAKIVAAEGRAADADALDIVARAAEGSVRDGLSLLDQALALGSGHATAELVLEMLGIAGRGAVFALLNRIFEGKTAAALACLNGLHGSGADPAMILTDLASAIHELSRLKAVPGVSPPDYSAADKTEAERLASLIGMSRLAIAWQMVLKGLDEVSRAGRPFAAAEMLIIRMCHASGLPAPAEMAGALQGKTAAPRGTPGKRQAERAGLALRDDNSHSGEIAGQHHAPLHFESFERLVAHIGELRDIKLKTALEEQVELVRFGPAFLELHVLNGAPPNLAPDLSRKLRAWTGQRWVVSLSEARGQQPLGAQKREAEARLMEEMRRHPAVKRVLHHFPDAQIKAVRAVEK